MKVEKLLLSLSDIELSYQASEGYEMASQGDLIVFVSTGRDDKLIAKGVLRDLARNLQQVRKEQGYNPTDILSALMSPTLTTKILMQSLK